MIKSMARERMYGQMDDRTREGGKMASKMAMDPIVNSMARFARESGLRASVHTGATRLDNFSTRRLWG